MLNSLTGSLHLMVSSHRQTSNRPPMVRSVSLLAVKRWLFVSRVARPAIGKATAETFASSVSRSACRREFGQPLPGKNSPSKGNDPVALPRRTMALPLSREGPFSFDRAIHCAAPNKAEVRFCYRDSASA